LIRGFPNGETHAGKTGVPLAEYIGGEERTQGSEPSQYLEEKKANAIPKVVASEIGTAQTFCTLPAIRSVRDERQKETVRVDVSYRKTAS
jgi:hypothetical protein